RGSAPKNARTTPWRGMTTSTTVSPRLTARRRERPAVGEGPGSLVSKWMKDQDVFNAGTGIAERRAVTRCKSALTGQDVGRWRRIRSLYCLIWAATLKSVRITVEGWAVANAVWAKVCVRRAWWRT